MYEMTIGERAVKVVSRVWWAKVPREAGDYSPFRCFDAAGAPCVVRWFPTEDAMRAAVPGLPAAETGAPRTAPCGVTACENVCLLFPDVTSAVFRAAEAIREGFPGYLLNLDVEAEQLRAAAPAAVRAMIDGAPMKFRGFDAIGYTRSGLVELIRVRHGKGVTAEAVRTDLDGLNLLDGTGDATPMSSEHGVVLDYLCGDDTHVYLAVRWV